MGARARYRSNGHRAYRCGFDVAIRAQSGLGVLARVRIVDRAESENCSSFLFAAVTGIVVSSLLSPIVFDVSLPALILGLAVAAWICVGRESNAKLSALVIFIFSALSMSMVFSVHADLADDGLIRSIAAISMLLSASFFGGLFKQITQWFPKQAPIGIRILSSWVVALIAIQIAMSTIS